MDLEKKDPAQLQTVSSNKEYNKKITSNVRYALTVTFKCLHCKTPRAQFYETAPYLTELLEKSTTFSLVPEWRHITGDIHMHGIIVIKDMIKWLKSTLPSLKSLGHICIKLIKDDYKEGWDKYIIKELSIAEGIIPSVPLPLTSRIYRVKKPDLKTYSVMDDYIIECLSD